MRASALIIRRFLERAIEDIRDFLNYEGENDKARNEASELYESMEANKTPPEVRGQGSPELTPEQHAAIEWRTAGGKPITDEQREEILAGVLPGQPMGDKGYASLGLALRGGWRESTRQAATWLRKAGETVAADGIECALEELGEASDAMVRSGNRDATRTAAEYLLRILGNCLPDEPTDPTNAIPGQRRVLEPVANPNEPTQSEGGSVLPPTKQESQDEIDDNRPKGDELAPPEYDPNSADWILSETLCNVIGIKASTIADYRKPRKCGEDTIDEFGSWNVDCVGKFRRQVNRKGSVAYYRPAMSSAYTAKLEYAESQKRQKP